MNALIIYIVLMAVSALGVFLFFWLVQGWTPW